MPSGFEERARHARMVDWYEAKTAFLLDKYGGRGRIHYHTGLFGPDREPAADLDGLREQIWQSQEDMLHHAAALWDAPRTLSGTIVDVGCGLGGGPLYWAETTGAHVTGVTPVPAHLPIIAEQARVAGVSDRVHAVLGNAHSLTALGRTYDTAIATGASNYFDRRRWFGELSRILRPGGSVLIEDTFWARAELAPPFNAYWTSNIGCEREYHDAAHEAGFRLVQREDVTADAAGFWRLSVAWSKQLLRFGPQTEAALSERWDSIVWQTRVHEGYLDGGFANLLLHYEKVR